MEILTKTCSKCKTEKSITEFNKCLSKKDGLYPSCKECRRKFDLENREKILAKKKIYREKHKDKINKQVNELYHKNKTKYNIARKKYAEDNKNEIIEYKKQYYNDNKIHINNKNTANYNINKESYLQNRKQYYNDNKEIIAIRNKEYREKNKEIIKERVKKYTQTKECKISKKSSNHLRNCKIRIENDKTINKKSLEELLIKQDNRCYYCKCELDFNIKFSVHLDHYIPIAKGGVHSINNVVWSCKNCNLSKQGKMPNEPLVL